MSATQTPTVAFTLLDTSRSADLLSEIARLGEESRLRCAVRRWRSGTPIGDLEEWWQSVGFELALSRGLL